MPVFNSAIFLRESIRSVLNQSFRDFELVAVDDGSSDDSWEILQSFTNSRRVKSIRCENNRGAATARNEAVARSDSEYIAFLDADDIARPHRLRIQVQVLNRFQRFDAVFGRAAVIHNRDLIPGHRSRLTQAEIGPMLLFRNCIVHSSVMVRRKSWLPYEAGFEPAEDYELWTRLAPFRTFLPLDTLLVDYREHEQGISKRLPEKMKKAVAAIHSLQLKRLGLPDRVDLPQQR